MKYTYQAQLAVITLFLLATVVMTWPATTAISTAVIGQGGDPWQTLWRFDQRWLSARQAFLTDGQGLNFIKHEFGAGNPRLVNLSVWPWMFIYLLFKQPIAYNLSWLISFFLSGYSLYLLVYYLLNNHSVSTGKRHACAFIAGLAYMLMPYHVAHSLGHFGAMQTQWLPLLILSSRLFINKATLARALLLSFFITIQAWTEHHYLVWYLLFSGWYLLFYRDQSKVFFNKQKNLLYSTLVVLLTLLTVVLPYWPTIKLAWLTNSPLVLGQEQLIRFSADPLSYFVPASFHSLWGNISRQLFSQHFTGNVQESTLYLGLVSILLVFFYHQLVPPRPKRFWLGTAAIFTLISLGPRLHLMGYVTSLYLPYALLAHVPGLSAIRTVARAAIMVNIAWAVLLGWVLCTQIKRRGMFVVVAVIIMLDFLFWPLPTMPYQTPSVYYQLSGLAGSAIIEIPAATNYSLASRALYGRKFHGKNLINNIALARAVGAETYQEVRSMPALRQLLYLRTNHILQDRDEFLGQDMSETLYDTLAWLDVRQLVVHPDSLSSTQQQAVIRLLEDKAGLSRTTVNDVWLYQVKQAPLHDNIFISRDDGWTEPVLDQTTNQIITGLSHQGALTIYNGRANHATVNISWFAGAKEATKLNIITTTQFKSTYDAANQTFSLTVKVPPGKTHLMLRNPFPDTIRIVNPTVNIIDENTNF